MAIKQYIFTKIKIIKYISLGVTFDLEVGIDQYHSICKSTFNF